MENFIFLILFSIDLILPVLLFCIANSFQSKVFILIRALVAIAVGWGYSIAYAFAANAIRLSFAHTEDEISAVYDSDGAPIAFALVLGWVIPTIMVILTLIVRWCFLIIKSRSK